MIRVIGVSRHCSEEGSPMLGKIVFRNSYLKISAMILLIAAVVIVVVVGTQVIVRKLYPDEGIERLENTHNEILRRLESIEESQRNLFAPAIDHVKRMVVHIIAYDRNDSSKGNKGSGVIIDKTKGYILTNYHVIENVGRVEVIFPNEDPRDDIAKGRSITIVGWDRLSDLALLSAPYLPPVYSLPLGVPESVPEIEWGDSKNLQLGEWAIAIGYPRAPIEQAHPTVTAGIISATSRNFLQNRLQVGMIQTDAPINKGNSGGALVNMHGQLIGINTRSKPKYYAEGMSYAIPANTAKKVVQHLIEHGCVIPPYLGIHTQPVTSDLIKETGIPYGYAAYTYSSPRGLADDGIPNYSGVYVADIDEGSPADNAGLKPGDFIGSRRRLDDEPPESEPTAIFNRVAIIGRVDFIENETHFKAMTRLLPIDEKIHFFFQRPIIEPNSRGKISGVPLFRTIMPLASRVELQPKVLQWHYTPPGWDITFKQPNREEAGKYKHRGVIVKSIAIDSALATVLSSGDLIYKIASHELCKYKIRNEKNEEVEQQKPCIEFEIHSLEEFTIYAPLLTSGELFWFHFERDGKNNLALITIPNVSLKKVLASPELWQKAVERLGPFVNPLKSQ